MKKLITVLITSSLMLSAAAAIAADEPQASPSAKKQQRQKARQERREARQEKQGNPAAGANAHAGMNAGKDRARANTRGNAQANTGSNAAQATERRNANRKAARADRAADASAHNDAQAQANQSNQQGNRRGAKGKKPDAQVVEKIRTQHANFHAKPSRQVPSVTFNESYRISGSDRWQGERYSVFRSYRPQRHDRNWWHSHYNNIVLIGGGYYYFNAGYWYPAWGYEPSASYYAYDGPIYAGARAEPPDRVIADVQAVLQEQGYYKGEVDGLLGPLTREALTGYQADNGLYTTAAIDEPTLESLGMAG